MISKSVEFSENQVGLLRYFGATLCAVGASVAFCAAKLQINFDIRKKEDNFLQE